MSDTVSIDAPMGETVRSLVAPLLDAFEVKQTESSASICDGRNVIRLDLNPYTELEEPEDMARVRELMGGPSVSYTLTTNPIELARRVLIALSVRRDLILDTQHGLILPLHEFADLIHHAPNWDWRQ